MANPPPDHPQESVGRKQQTYSDSERHDAKVFSAYANDTMRLYVRLRRLGTVGIFPFRSNAASWLDYIIVFAISQRKFIEQAPLQGFPNFSRKFPQIAKSAGDWCRFRPQWCNRGGYTLKYTNPYILQSLKRRECLPKYSR